MESCLLGLDGCITRLVGPVFRPVKGFGEVIPDRPPYSGALEFIFFLRRFLCVRLSVLM